MRDFQIFRQVRRTTSLKRKKNINDIISTQKGIKTRLSSRLFAAILYCSQHIEILTKSVSTSHGEMLDFRIFRQVRQTTSLKQKRVLTILFYRKKCQNRPFEQSICYNSLLFTTYRNIDKLSQHVTERNARFSNYLPSSADDVVETKQSIGDIVTAQMGIKTGLFSELFVTIFCFSQHIEIITNSVST